jgi:DHA3 family macrolide efflux protein-like MFS transporter
LGDVVKEGNKIGGMRAFLILWFGQVISLLGSGLTSFALGVWVYQRTGSVTQFALILFFASLPGLVLSPIAGALVDRWNRRRTLILSNCLAAVMSATLLFLFWDEAKSLPAIWHIYVLMAIFSVASALQWPAFTASTTLLVARQHYGRASGLSQMGLAIAQVVSPFLGALLLQWVHMRGILLLDLASFGFAVLSLLLVSIREPERAPETGPPRSLLQDSMVGGTYLRERPGLLALLILFAGTNFSFGTLQALLTPLVLSFASPRSLGTVLSAAGLGMLLGTLVMGVWGGPRRRVNGIFAGLLMQALVLLAGGWQQNLAAVGIAASVFLFALPMINGCSQAIWQAKVPAALQGRVFAVRRMVALSSLPVAHFMAGPLADRVFEPMLARGGLLAGSVGAVIGVGPGRGIGFLFVLLGLLMVAGLFFASSYRRLRLVEDELPDAEPDEPPASAPPRSAATV